MWLMGLLWPLAGLGELWGRLLSAGFSALTAVYLFLFLERKLAREAAFYGAVLFTVIPLEMYFGRTVQPEALALFATMAALYHWDVWLDAPKRRSHWAAATVFAFLAIAHKLPYLYLLLPLAALAWLKPRRRELTDPWAWSSCALALGGVFAWYRYASTGVFVVPAHAGEFLTMLEYSRLPYFTKFLFLSRFHELSATYGGLVLGAVGAWQLVREKGDRFFAAWWCAVALDQIVGGGYTHWHEYTALPWAPVNAAFMGAGLFWLKTRISGLPQAKRPRAWAVLALVTLSIPVHGALRIRHWYKVEYPYLWNAREAAASVSRPEDLFVCNERTSSAFLFYLDRKGWAWEVGETGVKQSEAYVEGRIKEGAKFLATPESRLSEPGFEPFLEYLNAHYTRVYRKDDLLIYRLKG